MRWNVRMGHLTFGLEYRYHNIALSTIGFTVSPKIAHDIPRQLFPTRHHDPKHTHETRPCRRTRHHNRPSLYCRTSRYSRTRHCSRTRHYSRSVSRLRSDAEFTAHPTPHLTLR